MRLKRIVFVFVVFLNRLMAFFAPQRQLHNARFAYIHELTSLFNYQFNRKTSLLLGETHFSHVLSVRPTSTRRELGNMLVVAPTRGGKGLLAVSQLLTWPHSVIVNDIKGDLFTQTAGYRATLGKVFCLDPTGVGHRFDPLEGRHTEDELLSSATQLLFQPDEGEGAIFTQRATAMLAQMFLAAELEKVPALPFVRELVRLGFSNCASRLNKISPILATQFLDLEYNELNRDDRFLLSAWGTLTAKVRPFLTQTAVRSLSGGDFSGEEIMTSKEPVTIYLRWKERDLLALTPLVRLTWQTLIDGLITTYDQAGGKDCKPVLILADEAGRTPIPTLADQATTVVGRGLSLWVAVQSLAQLDAAYGKVRARVLRDNMETQLYYRPADLDTADHLEHRLGRRSDYAHSQTTHQGSSPSQGLSEQGIPLMTAQEIMHLRDTDIIGFHRLLQPFRAARMDWRRFPILRQRQAMPPPLLPILPPLEERLTNRLFPKKGQILPDYINPDEPEGTPN
jgi:type IV secretion system protein VirD4